ncbi:MAG: hypothetical protein E6J46_01585 [Chloroflexi bacterium]|nr:MAG: hypothetical protein E6J46_01585 [Chloroflexota bacterium]
MPDATTELDRASADIALTRDAREILERAVKVASARGSLQVAPADVFNATLQLPGSLADTEIHALGFDPKSILPLIESNGAATSPSLRHLLVNANREAQVLGHYQVDSIHLLLAMLYSDSPSTSVPLQKAGLTLYDLRRHVQTGSRAGVPSYRDPTRPDAALRRRPWPSLRGVSAPVDDPLRRRRLDHVVVHSRVRSCGGRVSGWRSRCRERGIPDVEPSALHECLDEPGPADRVPAAGRDRAPGRCGLHQSLRAANPWLELGCSGGRTGRDPGVRLGDRGGFLDRKPSLVDRASQHQLLRRARVAWILHGHGGRAEPAARARA